MFNFYGNKCIRCGKLENATVDHVVPLSRGGRNEILNCQPLCITCNDRKGVKTIDYRNEKQIREFQVLLQQKKTMVNSLSA